MFAKDYYLRSEYKFYEIFWLNDNALLLPSENTAIINKSFIALMSRAYEAYALLRIERTSNKRRTITHGVSIKNY